MTKPWWERTLVHRKRGHEMRVTDAVGADDPLTERHVAMVYTPSRHDGDGILTWEDADRAAEELARGLSSAPDMARALLFDLGEHGHTADCSFMVTVGGDVSCSSPVCRQKRAALAKAGVPLP